MPVLEKRNKPKSTSQANRRSTREPDKLTVLFSLHQKAHWDQLLDRPVEKEFGCETMNVDLVRVRARGCGIEVCRLNCDTGSALGLHIEYGALCVSRLLRDLLTRFGVDF